MKIKSLFACLLLLALLTGADAQTLDKAKLDQFFDRLAEKNKAMGSVVLARDGKVIYARPLGYAQINGAEKKLVSMATRYRIGSVTKTFTSAIILRLVEEGKLKLTDTLDKFYPQIANAPKITIAEILTHRSGIHDSLVDPKMRTSSKENAASKDELLAIVAKGVPDFEPDTNHRYSNSGYVLLALIIEKVTGKSYEEILRAKITSKIGLHDTYNATSNIDAGKNEAFSYLNLGGNWKLVPETHPSNLFGAGSIISTPNDLVKFIRALFDGKIIKPESLALMKTIRDEEGMGLVTFTYNGKTFYGHTGGTDNFGTWLAYLPEEKLAFAYTTNGKAYPVGKIVDGIFDIYYNKPFQIPTFEAFAVSPEILDRYAGSYSIPGTPAKLTITREGGTLFFQPPGESPVALEATAEDKFKLEGALVIEFDAAKNQMTIIRGGGARIFTKDK